MTNKYFFDTDCLSAFLWVREESIIISLYGGKIVIPAQVYNELGSVPHLRARIDSLKQRNLLSIESIEVGSTEFNDFCNMTITPDQGMRLIGDGEAACIAMAKNRNGIIASNNLRDVKAYVRKYSLKHITSGDIMIAAYKNGIITETEGNAIWQNMINRNRQLPTASFSEYLNRYGN